MTHHWVNQHSPDCPITKERRDLIRSLDDSTITHDTHQALLGAVAEYDLGGDQEVENCTCSSRPS